MGRTPRKPRGGKALRRPAPKRGANPKPRKAAKRRPGIKKRPRKAAKPQRRPRIKKKAGKARRLRASPKRKPAKARRRAPVKTGKRAAPRKRALPKRRLKATAKKGARKPTRAPAKRRPAPKPKRRPAPQRPPARRPARHQARVSVFIATSVDGFIARSSGDLDFLSVPGDPKGEDYGYRAFVGEIDAIVMGRRTFEKVSTFKSWPYGKTPVVVLTTRPLPVHPLLRGKLETMADRPEEVVRRLHRRGLRRLYIDGGRTVQGFLRAGVVHEITITRVPVLLGQGVPLFGALPADVRLKHLETRAFKSGMVQTTYVVKRAGKKEEEAPTVEEEFTPRAPVAAPVTHVHPEPPPEETHGPSADAAFAPVGEADATAEPESERKGEAERPFPEPDPAAGQAGEDE